MIHDPRFCKLGKLPVKAAKLRLSPYLRPATLALAPPEVDWTKGITNWGVMLNDQLGDCTIAACAHAVQVWTANQSRPGERPTERTVSDALVESYYSKWCGYVPGNPSTDTGAAIAGVLTTWQKEEFSGAILDGFVDANPTNIEQVKQAVNIFGVVDAGVELPIAAQNQNVWDVSLGSDSAPGSWGGHSVALAKYNATGPVFITWGALKQATWAWWRAYASEAKPLLSPLWMNREGKSPARPDAPQGVDFLALHQDLACLG